MGQMTIALIRDGAIAEQRDMALSDVPQHKRGLWRPIEGDPPAIDSRWQSISGPSYQIEAERVLRVWTVTTVSLADYKAKAKASISQAAEAAREKYLTPGSGKALSYRAVADEAARYVETNGQGTYPFLQARVTSGRYPDLAAAAAGTLAIEAQWATVGAAIDAIEDGAKLAIEAAADHAAVHAVQVTWP